MYYFRVTILIILSVAVMAIGAIMAGVNDLEFNFIGYFWMGVNCTFTAGDFVCTFTLPSSHVHCRMHCRIHPVHEIREYQY